MRSRALVVLILGLAASLATASSIVAVVDSSRNVTFKGTSASGVESFLDIKYGKDTSGQGRFAPPVAYDIPRDSMNNATVSGPVCPQVIAGGFSYQSNATEQSEDCLRLKIARPVNTTSTAKLPVMAYIYGGGLWNGQIYERTTSGEGLVHRSVLNGQPVIYVAMNYRLNIFGFALNDALRTNKSLNVGLRDQRLALEWIQNNIATFGGDPDRVTIFGQSSGALSVTMQVLAYGGNSSTPFHGAIMQSTALEPTSTSNLTRDTFENVLAASSCNMTDSQSYEAIECLRSLSMESLLDIAIAEHDATSAQNDGDIYLPTIDDDFLPDAASQLVQDGRFAKMPMMIGWMQDDATLFTPTAIQTANDTKAFLKKYWTALSPSTSTTILNLYPSSSFTPNITANLSSEYYRSARIFRDILLTCLSFLVAHAMSLKYINATTPPPIYLYNHNQTILHTYLDSIGDPGFGVIHTSDLEYVFGNFTPYRVDDTVHPSADDYELMREMVGSWTSFAYTGNPASGGMGLKGWREAYESGDAMMDASIYISGGPYPGMSRLSGNESVLSGVVEQRLGERCGFLNSKEVVRELQY